MAICQTLLRAHGEKIKIALLVMYSSSYISPGQDCIFQCTVRLHITIAIDSDCDFMS